MTVVVGVDGSPRSRAALRLAAQEAQWRQVPLVAVSAYEPPLSTPPGGFPVAALHTDEEERSTAESTLRDTVNEELGDQAGQADLRVSTGLAGRVIVETASQTNAQLIVLAASPGKSLLPGSVSQYVLLKAECPVMLVPSNGTGVKQSHHETARLPGEIEGGPRMATVVTQQQQPIRSTIPARLDRLRWSPFHTRLVLGLGTAWVLDGLSVTIASSVSSKLTQPNTLNLTTTQAASIGTVYLVGEVVGALVFGRLSDQLGRRNLFMWTLAVYLVGTGLTALTPRGADWILYLFATRFIAGTGIGGEYSAINSAIDEMMPARYRGRTDIWINGTYWLGAILGTFASFLLLNSLRPAEGWRVAFLIGPALAVVIIFVRRNLPESPRWLIAHGRVEEAEEQMRRIEEVAMRDGQHLEPIPESAVIVIKPEKRYGYLTLLRVAFRRYPQRAILGATLMITQSFLYNAIFFTYALVLTKFYHVSNDAVPLYGLAFAVGNLAGPLLLGPLFDSLGRKKMISGTYLISGTLLAFSAWLFDAGVLHAAGQTFIWIVVFFFASAGASAGYLTVSEIFPIEIRAEALAVFFAIAQIFGAIGPVFYGVLIGNGTSRTGLAIGYLVGGGIMMIGGLVEIVFGVNAEGKPLEEIAAPLSEVDS